MAINKNNDDYMPEDYIPEDADDYYETIASQEEIYLEETEEEVRAILISYEATSSENGSPALCGANNHPCPAEPQDQPPDQAAGELITGGADDTPLSEEVLEEMLRAYLKIREPGPL